MQDVMKSTVRTFLRRKHRTNTIAKKSTKPRLIVSRSNKHIHAQVIDAQWIVLASAYDTNLQGTKKEKALQVGKALWATASKNWVTEVVFDRNWFLYHGRVAKVAEWAREAWLVF